MSKLSSVLKVTSTSSIFAFALFACGGTFRVAKKTPDGGIVALIGIRDDAHAKAGSIRTVVVRY